MKTGDLARLFGVSDKTIRDWIEVFADFFSEDAQGLRSKQRNYSEADILTLATIAKYSVEGLSRAHIKEKLLSGDRVEHPGVANFGVDTRMVPAAAVEQIIDSTEVRIELEQMRAERDKLLSLLEHERHESREREERLRIEIKNLQEQMILLQRELGRAEGELSYRRELEKKRSDSEE